MERLTVNKFGNSLINYGNGQYSSPCYGCEHISTCDIEAHEVCELYKAVEKLKKYEDLEEQGLLPQLPCSIGSDVYFIPSKVCFNLNRINEHEESNRVYHQKVARIVFTECGWYLECDKDLEYGTDHILVDKLYKDTWFLSQAEAEETLKRMEGQDNVT